jgi:hypothetical protein
MMHEIVGPFSWDKQVSDVPTHSIVPLGRIFLVKRAKNIVGTTLAVVLDQACGRPALGDALSLHHIINQPLPDLFKMFLVVLIGIGCDIRDKPMAICPREAPCIRDIFF